jgi:predicted esterase
LYFRSAAAAIQVNHGTLDRPVPVRNSEALERRLVEEGAPNAEVLFHAGFGHDLRESMALTNARQFLVERLSH